MNAHKAVATARRTFDVMPSIIGPAVGAWACDDSLRVERALFHLHVGISDALDDLAPEVKATVEQPLLPSASELRAGLSARAGEEDAAPIGHRNGNRLLRFSEKESARVAMDLCLMNVALRNVASTLPHDLRRRAEQASAKLHRLRAKLGMQGGVA
jgi:hypothetical protein